MAFPKNHLRFLPTLTHVVDPTEYQPVEVVDRALEEKPMLRIEESKIQEIVQAIMPSINAQLRETAQRMLDDKLHQLEADMRVHAESMVRSAISACQAPPKSGLL